MRYTMLLSGLNFLHYGWRQGAAIWCRGEFEVSVFPSGIWYLERRGNSIIKVASADDVKLASVLNLCGVRG